MNTPHQIPTAARVIKDIPYTTARAERHTGDLYFPENPSNRPPVLLIHGGGWDHMSKDEFLMLIPFFLEAGRMVFTINYRLIRMAPWPACGDDCLEAGQFVLGGGLREYGLEAPSRMMICGASAGGHLAMMTGIRLPRERVESIVSLAGPSRFDWVIEIPAPGDVHRGLNEKFFGSAMGSNSDAMRSASPAFLVPKNPPPLFCLHSINDQLVIPEQSDEAVNAWRDAGGYAEVTKYAGPGENHGFCVNDDRAASVPMPAVAAFMQRVCCLNIPS